MASNLFVGYDLHDKSSPSYAKLELAIKFYGKWAHITDSLWYLKTDVPAVDVAKKLWSNMTANDKLIVIDMANKTAYWFNLDPTVAAYMTEQWIK